MRESAVSAKRGWGLVWRETGAVRNVCPSRGQAASTRGRRCEKGRRSPPVRVAWLASFRIGVLICSSRVLPCRRTCATNSGQKINRAVTRLPQAEVRVGKGFPAPKSQL